MSRAQSYRLNAHDVCTRFGKQDPQTEEVEDFHGHVEPPNDKALYCFFCKTYFGCCL